MNKFETFKLNLHVCISVAAIHDDYNEINLQDLQIHNGNR